MDEIKKILSKSSLRHTDTRENLLSLLMKSHIALSESELQWQLRPSCDRTTIYRTLKTFLKKGIIHRVIVDDQNKYVFKPVIQRNHNHAHFKCNQCGEVSCLEDVSVRKVALPKGYKTDEVNLLVMGQCNKCNHL